MGTALVAGLTPGRAGVSPGPLGLGILVQAWAPRAAVRGVRAPGPGLRPVLAADPALSSPQPPPSGPEPAGPHSLAPQRGWVSSHPEASQRGA